MPALPRILVVEDEVDMVRLLRHNLEQEGYAVLSAGTGDEGLALARAEKPDLVLLDLRLPGIGGLNVLRALKAAAETREIPVVIVSALGSEDDVVLGLDLGADDYISKPFRVRELLARAAAALRRREAGSEAEERISCGDLCVDLARHETVAGGEPVALTPSEQGILVALMRRPGRVLTRRQLCDQALRGSFEVQERAIDAHVRTIRRKLGSAGKRIATVWGVGYKFAEE